MKNYSYIGVIACLFFYLLTLAPCHAQPGDKHKNLTDFMFLKSNNLNISPPHYKSINHADAVGYQDIKRGVFYLSKSGRGTNAATSFLVNTASQNKKPYMITTASFFTKENEETIGKKDQFIDVSIQVNGEVPNAENGTISVSLRSTWSTKIKLLVLHREADIALFEVLDKDGEPKKTGTEAAYEGLYNAYALGWDISTPPANPNLLKQYISANITIPKNSYKSIFLNPQSVKFQEHNNAASPIAFKKGRAYTVNWRIRPVPKDGVHGSPLFNDQGQVVGLHSGPGLNWDVNPPRALINRFLYTALQNSWNYQEKKTDAQGEITQPAGLIDYLDPDRTYVTNIPGGYWADLKAFPKATPPRSIPDVFSFDVTTNRIEISKDYPLFFTDIQNLKPRDGVFRRPFGIRVNGELSGNQSVYLYATKNIINAAGRDEEHLIWALQARDAADRNPRAANDPNQLGDPFGLRELGFYGSEVEFAFANSKFIINQYITDTDFNNLKTFDLNSMANGKAFSNTFSKIYENNLNNVVSQEKTPLAVNLYLSQTNDLSVPIPVVAVGIPGIPPKNLNQLMNPNAVQNAFKANEYQLLEVNSDQQTPRVYLDYFDVKQIIKKLLGSKLRIIGFNASHKGRHHSGDNGGYLNMVNPLTYIGDIECSYLHIDDNNNIITKEKKIQLFFDTPASCNTEECKYKVWIDYSQDHRYSGDYTGGGVQSVPELILQGTIEQGDEHRKRYKVEYEVPNEQDLDIAPGKKKAYRMRVAVSTADIPDQPDPPANATDPLTPWEMNNGEVEDYLIVFKALSNKEKEEEAKGSKSDIATNNRVAKRAKLSDHTPPAENPGGFDAQVQDFINNFFGPGPDDNNANNLALAISLVNVGQSLGASIFLIIKMGDILSLAYQHLVGGWGDNDPNNPDDDDPKPGESCSGDPLADASNPLNYDPTDPEAWEYWAQFNSLYNNVARIINFWNNLTIYEGSVPVAFIADETGAIDYALWNAFVDAYNVLAHFRNANNAIDFTQYYDSDGNFDHDAWNSAVSTYNALNGIDTLYDLLLLVYNNDALLAAAFGGNADLFKSLFSYILKFQCFKQQLIEDANEGERELDFTNTAAKIMLDAQGETVSDFFKHRETENNFTLTELPNQGELGVVYHAKDDGKHEVIVGVNSNGKILYYLKNDGVTKSITSTTTWGKGEDASIINRFAGADAGDNNGKIELEIEIDGNSELSSTEGIQATVFGFIPEEFKKLSNGARVGAPLANETNTEETISGFPYTLVPINAEWNSTFYNSHDGNAAQNPQQRKQLHNLTKSGNASEVGNQAHANNRGAFRIYPNPTDGDLYITTEANYGEDIAITIFDLAGRLVYEKEATATKQGQQKLTLNDIKLVAGQYVVKVTANKVTQSEIVTFE